MNRTFKRLVSGSTLLTALLFTGCASFSSDASRFDPTTDRVQDHLYAGIGAGAAWKQPDVQTTNFDVNDRVNGGGQLTVGMDLSRQAAVELHTADLGSAGFTNGGRIDYNIHGGSVLLYAGKNRHNFKRRGFSGFARVGVGYLQNDNQNVPFRRVNPVHALVGAGVEYMFSSGLGLRLEGISFEEDARFGQLGLVYRTGRRPERRIQQVQAPVPAPEPAPIVAAAIAEEPDLCTGYFGNLDGVNFQTDSAQLTDTAISILDSVAVDLAQCPAIDVTVSAHTDSVGSETYNQGLSERRAHSVSQHLESRGIGRERLRATAFGETQPIDTNDTAFGRSQNRRVELFTE